MTYKVIIREEAQKDTLDAYNYYEQQRIGLGDEFLISLIKRYDDLAEHPSNYGYIKEQSEKILRDTRIERFPFVIIFEIKESDVIVYAVHNTRRYMKNQ